MVYQGIDCIEKYEGAFRGKRLGLITSASMVDRLMQPSIQVLHRRFDITCLLAPEHGIWGDGEAGQAVEGALEPSTGLPVYSLYRKDSKGMTEEILDQVDGIIYDMQDVGVRYYTYLSVLLSAMEGCARKGKELIVLDRYNPLGGYVEGNWLDRDFCSFVGCYPLCMRHGLTVGEAAAMVNQKEGLGCHLTLVPCQGLAKDMVFPDMGNAWVMPSPGMPRFETALAYVGTCLFEGTNVSEGRGTAAPFEILGAPYVDGRRLAQAMNQKKLPGACFSPIYFQPYCSKYQGQACQGIHIHILDHGSFLPARTGLELLFTIGDMWPESFAFLPPAKPGERRMIELLYGSSRLLVPGVSKEEEFGQFQADSQAFFQASRAYWLYPWHKR